MDFSKQFIQEDDTGYNLNVQRCSAIPNLPAVIKNVFTRIMENGYIVVGDYFAEMSNFDVVLLSELSDRIHPDNRESYSKEAQEEALYLLTLFSLGLATGEGLDLSDEMNEKYIKASIMLIALESLHRKGLIKVYHENWSLDGDSSLPIADRP